MAPILNVQTEAKAVAPAEKYGASTRAVLQSLNYAESEIERLIASGTTSESWSEEHLPSQQEIAVSGSEAVTEAARGPPRHAMADLEFHFRT